MKKNLFISVFVLTALTAVSIVYLNAEEQSPVLAASLLDENVEALTQGEDGGSTGCKTVTNYYSTIFYVNGSPVGQRGCEYRCETGYFSECKEGREYDDYSMTPYPNTMRHINETTVRTCK